MNILIVNFGNPRFVCDSFGPLLGTLLQGEDIHGHTIHIEGTCFNPVHTMDHYYNMVELANSSDWDIVITTDAAVSEPTNFNKLFIRKGGVHPGKGCGKQDMTQPLGDYNIVYGVGPSPLEVSPTQSMVSTAAKRAVSEIKKLIYRLCGSSEVLLEA